MDARRARLLVLALLVALGAGCMEEGDKPGARGGSEADPPQMDQGPKPELAEGSDADDAGSGAAGT